MYHGTGTRVPPSNENPVYATMLNGFMGNSIMLPLLGGNSSCSSMIER